MLLYSKVDEFLTIYFAFSKVCMYNMWWSTKRKVQRQKKCCFFKKNKWSKVSISKKSCFNSVLTRRYHQFKTVYCLFVTDQFLENVLLKKQHVLIIQHIYICEKKIKFLIFFQGSDPRAATCRGKLQSKRSKLNMEINKELMLRAGAENLFK